MIVAISMILLGALVLAGIFGALYLGMTDQQQQEARDALLFVGTILLAIGGVALIAFGIHELVTS